jgi:hypothetical protein
MANFSLLAKLGLDSKGFQKGLNTATKRMGNFRKSVSRTFSGMKGSLLQLAGIGALGAMGSESLRLADNLKKTADRLGLTTDSLQDFTNSAKLNGIEVNTASLGLQRFVRRLGEAQQGTGELKGTLDRYGIAVKDSTGNNRDAMDVLNQLADTIQAVQDPQERLTIAFKAFDSEGADMVRILQQGSGGLERFAEKAELMFGKFSPEQIQNLSDAKTQLEAFGRSMTIAFGGIVENINPALEAFSNFVQGVRGDSTNVFKQLFDPKNPEAFADVIEERVLKLLKSEDFSDIKLKLNNRDLELIAGEIAKIKGQIEDIDPRFLSGMDYMRFISPIKKELKEIQKEHGSIGVINRLNEIVHAKINQHIKKRNPDLEANNEAIERQKQHLQDIAEIQEDIEELETELLQVRAKGSKEEIDMQQQLIDIAEMALGFMEDQNMERNEAIKLARQIVQNENNINATEKDNVDILQAKNSLLEEELELLRLMREGTDEEIDAQEKKIELMKRALQLMEQYGISAKEAAETAKAEAEHRSKIKPDGGDDKTKTKTNVGQVKSKALDEIATELAGIAGQAGRRFDEIISVAGEKIFRRFDNGKLTGEFSEEQMRNAIQKLAEKADERGLETILEQIKDAINKRVVSE